MATKINKGRAHTGRAESLGYAAEINTALYVSYASEERWRQKHTRQILGREREEGKTVTPGQHVGEESAAERSLGKGAEIPGDRQQLLGGEGRATQRGRRGLGVDTACPRRAGEAWPSRGREDRIPPVADAPRGLPAQNSFKMILFVCLQKCKTKE